MPENNDASIDQVADDDDATAVSAAYASIAAVNRDDEGPGCLPGMMAGTLVVGMIGFILCGGCTWWLYQQRTELAVRTIEQTYLPHLEQSYLQPDEKAAVTEMLEEFSKDMQRGKYENWQSSGVMTRIVRMPIFQWGELNVVESHLQQRQGEDVTEALKILSRLRRAIEEDFLTSVDAESVLAPVMVQDDSLLQRSIAEPLDEDAVDEVVVLAEQFVQRMNIPDKQFSDVSLEKILRRQIEAGLTEGSY